MNEKYHKIAWLVLSFVALPVYILSAWFNTWHLPNQFQIVYLVPIVFYFSILFGYVNAWYTIKSEEEKVATSTQQETEVKANE